MARGRINLRRAALTLARVHNATLAINRLPPEIFLEIILVLRSEFRPEPIFTPDIISPEPDPYRDLLTISTWNWLPVAQACKPWWDLACGRAQLWRAIDVHRNLDWLRLCLSRSGDAPIDLSLHDARKVLEALPIISPVKDRIVTLRLPLMDAKDVPSVMAFLDQGLTNVREALIPRQPHHNSDAVPGFPDPSAVPQLRHLCVNGFRIPWIQDVISHLVSLEIAWTVNHGWTEDDDMYLDLESFLSLLQAAKSLQNLRLEKALWQGIDFWPERSGELISLPNLRVLDVYDLPENIARFLACLSLPPDVALGVHNLNLIVDDNELPFLDLFPDDFRNIEILTSATYASMHDPDLGILDLEARVELEPYTRRYLEVSMFVFYESDATTFMPLFDDFLQLFRHAPLVRIDLEGDIAQVTKEKWTSLFVQFPNLRNLKIDCCGSSLASVFSALSEVSADDNRKVVCPNFGCIEIGYGPKASEGEVTNIERCLQRRKELGADSLERLSVKFKKEEGMTPALRREHIVDRLRDLVPDLILESYTPPFGCTVPLP